MGNAISDDNCCGLAGRDENESVDIYFADQAFLVKKVEAEFLRIFKEKDKDRSGLLDSSECEDLMQELRRIGFVMDARNVKEFLKEADANGDEKVSMQEFKDWMKEEVGKRHENLLAVLDQQNWLKTEPAFTIFDNYKVSGKKGEDGSGNDFHFQEMSVGEAKSYCSSHKPEECGGFCFEGQLQKQNKCEFKGVVSEETLEAAEGWTTYRRDKTVLERCDANGDGDLDKKELQLFFEEVAKSMNQDPPEDDFVDKVLERHGHDPNANPKLNQDEFLQILKTAVVQLYLYSEVGASSRRSMFLEAAPGAAKHAPGEANDGKTAAPAK